MTVNPKADIQAELLQQIASNLTNSRIAQILADNPKGASEFLAANRRMLFDMERDLDMIAASQKKEEAR